MSIEDNKIIAKKYHLEFCSKWNFDLIDEIIHEDYELHESSVGIVQKEEIVKGKEGFRKRMKRFATAFPDLKYGIIKIIAEGDSVIVWWALRATQADEIFGFPSKGQKIQIFGTNHFTMKDGKIISNIINYDTFSFLIQLGHVTINTDQDDMVMQYLKHLESLRL